MPSLLINLDITNEIPHVSFFSRRYVAARIVIPFLLFFTFNCQYFFFLDADCTH